eukprot:GILK01011382.1.p1 GENE.GILK01011382.1~~GILK01011382.1.p1  ORF type:complete len:686 (+),score=100.32 GILK01011382.1:36-2093(+)
MADALLSHVVPPPSSPRSRSGSRTFPQDLPYTLHARKLREEIVQCESTISDLTTSIHQKQMEDRRLEDWQTSLDTLSSIKTKALDSADECQKLRADLQFLLEQKRSTVSHIVVPPLPDFIRSLKQSTDHSKSPPPSGHTSSGTRSSLSTLLAQRSPKSSRSVSSGALLSPSGKTKTYFSFGGDEEHPSKDAPGAVSQSTTTELAVKWHIGGEEVTVRTEQEKMELLKKTNDKLSTLVWKWRTQNSFVTDAAVKESLETHCTSIHTLATDLLRIIQSQPLHAQHDSLVAQQTNVVNGDEHIAIQKELKGVRVSCGFMKLDNLVASALKTCCQQWRDTALKTSFALAARESFLASSPLPTVVQQCAQSIRRRSSRTLYSDPVQHELSDVMREVNRDLEDINVSILQRPVGHPESQGVLMQRLYDLSSELTQAHSKSKQFESWLNQSRTDSAVLAKQKQSLEAAVDDLQTEVIALRRQLEQDRVMVRRTPSSPSTSRLHAERRSPSTVLLRASGRQLQVLESVMFWYQKRVRRERVKHSIARWKRISHEQLIRLRTDWAAEKVRLLDQISWRLRETALDRDQRDPSQRPSSPRQRVYLSPRSMLRGPAHLVPNLREHLQASNQVIDRCYRELAAINVSITPSTPAGALRSVDELFQTLMTSLVSILLENVDLRRTLNLYMEGSPNVYY